MGRVLKILKSIGLARTDAEIYVYLAKEELQKGRNIAETLKKTPSF